MARITIDFLRFDLEQSDLEECPNCSCDSLKIYDGNSTRASQLGPLNGYCGNNKPKPSTSTGHCLLIVFRSDGGMQKSGFHIIYKGKSFFRPLKLNIPCEHRFSFICVVYVPGSFKGNQLNSVHFQMTS